MNICSSQTVHNRPKSAREVGRSPYLVRRAERVLFMNSANGLVLFPCRTTWAPWRIAPLKLPIILKFRSPSLRCAQWDVTPSPISDNALSQIFPVHYDVKEWMPTSLVKRVTTKLKLIKGNRSHRAYIRWKGNKCHPFNSRRARLKGSIYYTHTRTHTHTHTHIHTILGLNLIIFSEKAVYCSVLFISYCLYY